MTFPEHSWRLGRPKLYKTPEELAGAISLFFGSITRVKELTEVKPIRFDKKGNAVEYAVLPILNSNNEPVTKLEWLDEAPTKIDMCLYIGCDPDTFDNYRKQPGYTAICNEAMCLIENRWGKMLSTIGNTRGIMFNLANNFGWTDDPAWIAGREERAKLKTQGDQSLLGMVNYFTSGEGAGLVQQITEGTEKDDQPDGGVRTK